MRRLLEPAGRFGGCGATYDRNMTPVARLRAFALDCPDPQALAEFYSAITGWEIERPEDDWVELKSDVGATLAFQRVDDHRPPVWPGSEHPQQAHLDFAVADIRAAEPGLLALGARPAEYQPGGDSWRVYLDPAGHPFCLVIG
jgi:catechol 2,3-dioxygenase-like lactoylglutathione lyase family enzyme